MNEPQDNTPRRPAGIMDALRLPLYALALLTAVWLVFGEIVPRFLFSKGNPHQRPPARQSETPPLPLPADIGEERLSAFDARLAQIEAKLNAHEEMLTAVPAYSGLAGDELPPVVADDGRIAALEEKLTALQSAMERKSTETDMRIAAMDALARLRDAALGGGDFRDHYQQFMKLNAAYGDIQEAMLPLSARTGGLPTPDTLRASFGALASKALTPEGELSITGNLRSLISIRKIGDQAGNSDEAVLARTEALLAKDHLVAAAKEMKLLSAYASGVYKSWLDDLHARIEAQDTLDRLQRLLADQPIHPVGQAPDRA